MSDMCVYRSDLTGQRLIDADFDPVATEVQGALATNETVRAIN